MTNATRAFPKASGIYLAGSLAPLAPFLARDDVTDLYINRSHEIWLETLAGAIEHHSVDTLTSEHIRVLAEQVAALTHQGISREHPLLSAVLPDGARIQFVGPPATRHDYAVAIRKHVATELALDDYESSGAFSEAAGAQHPWHKLATELQTLHRKGAFAALLKLAVQNRLNVLVSGGTSTGKTTFLNALIREIPLEERIIVIEDTPELALRHANAVGLVAARSALGEAVASTEDLLNASLRLRPDRILLGELRGPEAFTFLRAINTGHPGSMTTIHADSPERAIEQIALMVLQTGTRLDRDSVLHYVRSSIDVFVQLGRHSGRRHISAVTLRSQLSDAGSLDAGH